MEYFRNHPEKGIIQLKLNKQTVRNLREQVRNHPNNQFIQANATKIEISEIQKKTSSLLFLPFYLILLGKKRL
jgi:hypothetical protein